MLQPSGCARLAHPRYYAYRPRLTYVYHCTTCMMYFQPHSVKPACIANSAYPGTSARSRMHAKYQDAR